MSKITAAFDFTPIYIPLKKLLESAPKRYYRDMSSYRTILASVREVGIIQPLAVRPAKVAGKYKILDGHMRYYALRELKAPGAYCVISHDDERYTFESKVNYLNPLQRSKMIAEAVKRGVSPEKIAVTLNMDIKKVMGELNIIEGIDPRVREILKSAPISNGVLQNLKKVKPLRQIEIAEVMIRSNEYTVDFVRGMVFSTAKSLYVDPDTKPHKKFIPPETLAALSVEKTNMQQKISDAQPVYNENVYQLTTIISFLRKLLSNSDISVYLAKHFSSTYEEFRCIEKMTELE